MGNIATVVHELWRTSGRTDTEYATGCYTNATQGFGTPNVAMDKAAVEILTNYLPDIKFGKAETATSGNRGGAAEAAVDTTAAKEAAAAASVNAAVAAAMEGKLPYPPSSSDIIESVSRNTRNTTTNGAPASPTTQPLAMAAAVFANLTRASAPPRPSSPPAKPRAPPAAGLRSKENGCAHHGQQKDVRGQAGSGNSRRKRIKRRVDSDDDDDDEEEYEESDSDEEDDDNDEDEDEEFEDEDEVAEDTCHVCHGTGSEVR